MRTWQNESRVNLQLHSISPPSRLRHLFWCTHRPTDRSSTNPPTRAPPIHRIPKTDHRPADKYSTDPLSTDSWPTDKYSTDPQSTDNRPTDRSSTDHRQPTTDPLMQNLLATCWVSLNMHILILQYKCTFSLYTYVLDKSDYFSLPRHFIHADDSVSVTLQYLHETITFY